jgi:hypothetical protein
MTRRKGDGEEVGHGLILGYILRKIGGPGKGPIT